MIEGIGYLLMYILAVAILFLEAGILLAIVKLGFIGLDFIDKVTDKLKKKVRE